MATHYIKLDTTQTAAVIRKEMAAFHTLYGESEYLVWGGNAYIHEKGETPELVRIERMKILRVDSKHLVVRGKFDNLIDINVKVALPSSYPDLYAGLDMIAQLYFITVR